MSSKSLSVSNCIYFIDHQLCQNRTQLVLCISNEIDFNRWSIDRLIIQDIELGHPLRCADVGNWKTSHQDTRN